MSCCLRQLAFTCLVALPLSALAQLEEQPGEGIRVFYPSYYDEFNPVSALELVFRTPGFQPQENSGGRGLSGVRSNILIDGVRPPPKGQSIRQQLREMPVASIERIELIDAGTRLEIDMQGYPQVVNVITVENPPAYYEVETDVRRAGTGDIEHQNEREIQVQATGSFTWRDHQFSMRGNIQDRYNQNPADIVAIDPANPVQRISSLNRYDRRGESVQLTGDFALPAESTLSFTSQFSTNEQGRIPVFLDLDPNVNAVTQQFDSENDNRDLSAEYRRPWGATNEMMIALVDSTNKQNSESSLTDAGLVRSSLNDRESGETAARALITQAINDQITLRTTAMTAFNYFEGGFRIFENGVELPIQNSNNRVEEDRHAIDGEVDWILNERWNLNGNVGIEAYEIESSTASSGMQTDPTGSVLISYRPQPRTTISFESSRSIGQLSFNQFLASSSLSSEILTAGASELEPQRSWSHTAKYDRRFGDRGLFVITLGRNKIDNPVDTVALSDSITVAQNTWPRTIDSLDVRFEYPLARFGREDLIVELRGYVADSDTIDPVTEVAREVSGTTKNYWQAQIRRLPGNGRLAWNFGISDQTPGMNYSVFTTNQYRVSREWGASVEWEPIDDFFIGASLNGPTTQTGLANIYTAVRAIGLDPAFFTESITNQDRTASLSFEWRRRDHIEIRGSINPRPAVRNDELLLAFGETMGTQLTTRIAETPRVNLRVRVYR